MAKTGAKKIETLTEAQEAAGSVVTSIKGFRSDLTCQPDSSAPAFQFEIGKSYSLTGEINACNFGFHACPVDEHPLSVFEYYPPAGARYAEVEQSGAQSVNGNKLASASITIKAEISLSDLIARAVKWVFDRSTPEGPSATGDSGAASATGYRGAASATGYSGAASATGDSGAASATGDSGAASATGNNGAASATGYRGAASATGIRGAASATGYSGAASATGKHSVAIGAGHVSRAMAGETGAICLVSRNENDEIVAIRASKVGENGVKPNVWYSLSPAGEFVEVEG